MPSHPIHKHRGGCYYARIQVNLERRTFWLGKNEDKARRRLNAIEKRLATGRLVLGKSTNLRVAGSGPRDMRVETLAHLHLEWVEANCAQGTYDQRKRYVKAFMDFVGPCMVSSVDQLRLEQFFAWAKKNHARSRNAGNIFLRHVKSLLLWARERDICVINVKRFPKMREYPPETKRFTDQEITALLKVAEPDFRDMLVFGLLTGLRPQELRPLKHQFVFFKPDGGGVARIEIHKTSATARVPLPRVIPLSGTAESIIHRQIESHPESEYVFLNGGVHGGKRGPYTARAFRVRFKRLCRKAKIKVLPPYALRHSFASVQAMDGTNQKCLADLLGHTTIRTTSRYVSTDEKYLQTAAENMDRHLSGLMREAVGNTELEKKCPVECPVGSKSKPVTGGSDRDKKPSCNELQVVGDTGLEPVTPTMSR